MKNNVVYKKNYLSELSFLKEFKLQNKELRATYKLNRQALLTNKNLSKKDLKQEKEALQVKLSKDLAQNIKTYEKQIVDLKKPQLMEEK
jgi:hypothetical protein